MRGKPTFDLTHKDSVDTLLDVEFSLVLHPSASADQTIDYIQQMNVPFAFTGYSRSAHSLEAFTMANHWRTLFGDGLVHYPQKAGGVGYTDNGYRLVHAPKIQTDLTPYVQGVHLALNFQVE